MNKGSSERQLLKLHVKFLYLFFVEFFRVLKGIQIFEKYGGLQEPY